MENNKNIFGLSRRAFLKWTSAIGLTVGVGNIPAIVDSVESKTKPFILADKIIRTGCPAHNCGGRCLLKVYIKDEKIIRIETDDRPNDSIDDPQLRACIRGRSYIRRQYHQDRLKYPLIREGKRGEGKFRRATWT